MRMRIIIGLVAVVAIGVGVFVVLQPRKGTVEWHKREYVAARDGQPVLRWIRRIWVGIMGTGGGYEPGGWNEMLVHEDALRRLGYLEERMITVSNCPARFISRLAFDMSRRAVPRDEPLGVYVLDRNTNHLQVIAPPKYHLVVEQVIRGLDVPKRSGK